MQKLKKTQIFGIVKLTVKKTVLKFVPLHKEIVNFRRKKKNKTQNISVPYNWSNEEEAQSFEPS